MQGAKNMVPTHLRQVILSVGSVSLRLLVQRTSYHLGHNSSAYFSGQAM